MPMYKDADITADLIKDKFPQVATEIKQDSLVGVLRVEDATAEQVRELNPTVYEEIAAAAAASAKTEGAEAESKRIAEIEAIAVPGYEGIISDMKADRTKTVLDAKIALFDAMKGNVEASAASRKKDGKELADDIKDLSGKADTAADDVEKSAKIMADAAKQV